ncbi:MAG: beta-lactamase family protein [Microbacteriaceae bacterium]|nr:beta-lactamase family protein [Burkholderiaceae bacterium]
MNAVLSQGVESGAVAGAVAAVANREGVVHEAAFGGRALGSGAAMTADSVCWIASMTKAITSVAAVQCAERGQLQLDEPAKNICPELGKVGVPTALDGQGLPLTRPPKRDITLRQLLTAIGNGNC